MPQQSTTMVGANPSPFVLDSIPAGVSVRADITGFGVWGGAKIHVQHDAGTGIFQTVTDVFVNAHRPTWSFNLTGPTTPRIVAIAATDATDLQIVINPEDQG